MDGKPYDAQRVGKNQLILTLHNVEESWFESGDEFYLVLKSDFKNVMTNYWRAGAIGIVVGMMLGVVFFGSCPIK